MNLKGEMSNMKLFEYMQKHGHEEVVYWSDEEVGLRAIIAIHDTTLGPALGGMRMWPYASEEEALVDVLRLSEGMTYKASVAGLDLGGGKAVIIGDPKRDKSEALFRSFGRFVDSLGRRYITAEDVGTKVEDMVHVNMETRHVTGLPASHGGSGDPSPLTAFGVYKGMKACNRATLGVESLTELTIAIQGLGKVGYTLAEYLTQEGSRVIASDIDSTVTRKAHRELGVEIVAPDEVYDVECDIFAPCALGGILNDDTIPRLQARIIAGAANNQLKAEKHGFELHRRNVLYTPDFVINAGGLISVATELGAYSSSEAWTKTAAIYDTVSRIIERSEAEDIPTHVAAYQLAKERIEREKSTLAPAA